ncbi:class I SAM-dependent methyltransferase [Maricaulis sp.]|uniref:class I SAM-dependent methyltransferase n=1 Tax=Maricaulis sp. TaxID=1486257 RepID=UPI0025BEC1E0|nr:class I SAM-dependent methyltransferase [Maricaulis sp.]
MAVKETMKPGDHHYRAYVGPPDQYDFMGATQFRLLTRLGLREEQTLLDIGCGSLRAGRLLMTYLEPGNYYGVEPNDWLIQKAVDSELGAEFIEKRAPQFYHGDDFDFSGFGTTFDYLVAQSIISHTGRDRLARLVLSAVSVMHERSRFLFTVIHEATDERMPPGLDEPGWAYPGCVWFPRDHIHELCTAMGGHAQELPWFHPRQTWWLMTRSPDLLLDDAVLATFDGRVFNDSRFSV